MAKTIVGLDIGNNNLKLAINRGKGPIHTESNRLPENMVKGGRVQLQNTMADYLKQLRKNKVIPGGAVCAIVLPEAAVICRRMTLPFMSREQLELNLPYEFKDYIIGEGDKYHYDYALDKVVLDEEGKPLRMELMAAAVQKSVIAEYRELFHMSGLNLRVILPQEMLWTSILQSYVRGDEELARQEYCIVDIGHRSTRVIIFKGDVFQTSRSIDLGGYDVDDAISMYRNVDLYVAQTYKETNYEGILDTEACVNAYNRIAIEIRKAIYFYRFNNPETELAHIYFAGGSAFIEPLCRAVQEHCDMMTHSVLELLPARVYGEAAPSAALAVGLAMCGAEVLKNG